METWYFLSLGDGLTSGMHSAEIEEAFSRVFANAGRSPTMAVFTRPELEGSLHCEIIAYFSPAARDLAMDFDAEPCERPAQAGLSLLAGGPEAWRVLFPEQDG